jgi:hypothetical protein
MTHRACRRPTRLAIVSLMKSRNRGAASKPWTSPRPNADAERRLGDDRRADPERRRRVWWSVVYGNFNPRRRGPQRRADDGGFQSRDWHSAHLLAVAIGILLLSFADALMTITLLSGGAIEVNPVMAAVVYQSAQLFAILKMTLTGMGVTFMVFLARYRFMRVIRVETVMYAVFVAYGGLLCYEFWMLRGLVDIR